MSSLEELAGRLFQAHPWHGVTPGENAPREVNVYVEIVPGAAEKYELDKPSGLLKIDRPQRFSSLCPTLYGFIPRTWCGPTVAARAKRRGIRGDGDPLDVCVLAETGIPHGGFLLRARPIGGLRMIDGGEADDKIVAVLESDPVYGTAGDVKDLPSAIVDRLRHYFLTYKQLPGKKAKVELAKTYGAAEARAVITASIEDYRAEYGPAESRTSELLALLSRSRR